MNASHHQQILFISGSRARAPHWSLVAAIIGMGAIPAMGVSPPDVSMFWQVAGDASTPINFDLAEAGIWSEQEDGSFVFSGNLFSDTWQLSWSTRVDTQTDLLLDSLISVTNTSSTEQWFTANTVLDSIDASINQQLLTLAATLTVMNLQFSGTAELSSTSSTSVIGSQVDGVTRGTLFDPIYVLTSAGPFAVATDSASMTAIAASVQQSLGNTSEFSLTAGDTATLHTITSLAAIPAPGSLALLAIAASSGGFRRRRRSRSLSGN
ncbi:MAG TPA: hypothetical protein DGN59_01040 [Candidatus Latescibacteria bacterium]|nr:hypothetical protein [Candidatus Latescibacterota bacterium]